MKTTGGSGVNQVAAAAVDPNGNLYMTGSTSSLDFPVIAAIQPRPGGSTLFRINRVTGASERLYPAGLSNVTSIAVDPKNPLTLYGTSGDWVWVSRDGGTSWSRLSNPSTGATAEFIARSETLYVGTHLKGVFKSSDGGLSWRAMNNGIPPASDGSISISRVWADPATPQVVFAAFPSGLLRSGDGTATWSLVLPSFLFGATLAFDPLNAGTIYVAAGMQLSKSTDDGRTFAQLSALPDNILPLALAADPFHAGVLYASSYDGIFESTDGGITWTKKAGGPSTVIAADTQYPYLYANISSYGVVRSSDGFSTSEPVGPPELSLNEIGIGGSWAYVIASSSNDAFVIKLDPDGNIVYSTYFGGSADDSPAAIAVGSDGSVYVAGATSSIDFPDNQGGVCRDARFYGSSFLFKLNPDGSLGWSTYFADSNTQVAAVVVDRAGNPYIGGSTAGSLPTTTGRVPDRFPADLFLRLAHRLYAGSTCGVCDEVQGRRHGARRIRRMSPAAQGVPRFRTRRP